jgi:predicted acyltransferase
MVIVNSLSGVSIIPGWLKHAPGVGLTFVDVIAPAFLFALGLTYSASFQRRISRDGPRAAIGHFLRRWFALIGMGAVLSAGEGFTGATGNVPNWGVLQAIAVAGLLTLPLVRRPVWVRLAAAGALLSLYQLGSYLFLADFVARSSHGGLWGSIAWTAALILATCFADHSQRSSSVPAAVGAEVAAALALIATGLLLSLVVSVSKLQVSASYVLATIGISSLIHQLFRLTADVVRISAPPLVWWGRNPLLLYVLHEFLRALVVLPGVDWWSAGASLPLVVGQVAFTLGVLTALSWWLYRKRVIVSL